MEDSERIAFSIPPLYQVSGIQKTFHVWVIYIKDNLPTQGMVLESLSKRCAEYQRMADPTTPWAASSWESYIWIPLLPKAISFYSY